MAQPVNTNALKSKLKVYFEREVLTGPNFNEWYRALRIVLRVLGGQVCLVNPMPAKPADYETNEVTRNAYDAEYKGYNEVAVVMLARMNSLLQQKFEFVTPKDMIDELTKMFTKPKAVEIYDLVDALHSCKQSRGQSVSEHYLYIKNILDQLQDLGNPTENDMAINLINRSLNIDFSNFVRNYNMHCVGKTVSYLHAMLIDFEKGLKEKDTTSQVFNIRRGSKDHKDNKPKSNGKNMNKHDKGKGKNE